MADPTAADTLRRRAAGNRVWLYVLLDANRWAVAGGLAPGERVVLSDLIPAIDGMRLAPERDPAARDRLLRLAGAGRTAETAAETAAKTAAEITAEGSGPLPATGEAGR